MNHYNYKNTDNLKYFFFSKTAIKKKKTEEKVAKLADALLIS